MHYILNFMIDFDPGALLAEFDILGLILGALSEFTILFDILIVMALVTTLLRGIFKKFWSMTWKLILFAILFTVFLIMRAPVVELIGGLALSFEATIDGVTYSGATLFETLSEMARISDPTIDGAAFATAFLSHLVIIVGIFPVMIITTIVSLITFPLVRLLIPKRVRKARLMIPSLLLSLVYFFLTLFIFASSAQSIITPLHTVSSSAAFNDQSLFAVILRPDLIDVLTLFTREKSLALQILDFGNVARFSPFFQKVGEKEFKTIYTDIIQTLNAIIPTA